MLLRWRMRKPNIVDVGLVTLSRREATKRIGGWVIFAGLTSVGCSGGGGSNNDAIHVESCSTTATGTNTGLLQSDVAAGNVAWDATDNLFVCHDADGFYAMSSICTHAGCDMAGGAGGGGGTPAATSVHPLADGFHCGCHGSAFDANGGVTQGPAISPLQHYKVSIAANGALWVDKSQTTDAGLRCT